MCTKSRSVRIWVLCITLVIGLLIVYGISYLNLRPEENGENCDWINDSDHELKQKFGDKLYVDIGEKYIKFLNGTYPEMIRYWDSIYMDLPGSDEHARVLLDIIKKLGDNFKRVVDVPHSKDQRIQILNTHRELQSKLYNLTLMDTEEMSSYKFFLWMQKHGTMEYREFRESTLLRIVKDMRESWRDMYTCIPKEYLKTYPDFAEIDEEFDEAIETTDIFNLLFLWAHLDKFFQNELY